MNRFSKHLSRPCRAFVIYAVAGAILTGAHAKAEIQAGASVRVITPNPLLPVSGGMGPTRPAREKRGALDLDLPERLVRLGDDGRIAEIGVRERLDSHKLIEEFMVLANVAAAQALEQRHAPCMYRVHDQPAQPAGLDRTRHRYFASSRKALRYFFAAFDATCRARSTSGS